MNSLAVVVNTTTLTNPNGTASDYALYDLELVDGRLYAGGWLNGQNSSPSNPDGTGLDRIYVSSSTMLDAFFALQWTNGQSPGTWNDANGQTTLYDEIANPGTGTYSLVPYYGPSQPLGGSSSLYYQVNDPTVVDEGNALVMYMSAVPCQNEYPATFMEPNGNPDFQVGWCEIGYAISTDQGATWTWEGTLPLLHADGTPLLAPVTQSFPTDPSVSYQLIAAGDGSPTAIFDNATGLDLWYSSFHDAGSVGEIGAPVLTLSTESTQGAWDTPRTCRLVTNAATVDLYVTDQDVALADDGSGTLWMVATQWHGPESGDIKLYYSGTADGVNQGVNWHTWDGADGVLVVATNKLYGGLYDLVTPDILSVGNGTISIDYSVPTVIAPDQGPSGWEQMNQAFTLPPITTPPPSVAFAGASDIFFVGTPIGDVTDWTTGNGQLAASSPVGTAGDGWRLLAAGDFAGQGAGGLLFIDQTGNLVNWILSAGQVSAAYYIGTVGNGWQFLAPADLNGDGTADLLFSGPNGVLVDWVLQNGQLNSADYIGTVGAGWRAIATGDFNGDGTSDLLFSGPAGQIVQWVINDSQVSGANYIGTVGAGWQFLATGDFNGDGTTDMLFNDTAGDIVDWIIKDGQVAGANFVGTAGSGWGLIAAGDYNHDGTTDLLFSGPGGVLVDWIMKNGQISSADYVGTAGGGWQAISNVA